MINIADNYCDWLKNNTIYNVISGKYTEISTPFLDRHNDGISIYIEHNNNGDYLLTDDGYTINDLLSEGFNMTPARKDLLNKTIIRFGVQRKDNEITIIANKDDIQLKIHLLIQAIISIGDMFMLSKTITKNLFFQDVKSYFDDIGSRYVENIEITGISGLPHHIDFLIAKNVKANKVESIIQTMNNPIKSNFERILFQWGDIKSVREMNYYLIVNDKNDINSNLKDAIKNYQGNLIPWSKKEKYRDVFVA